jgi:hypothetical protein
MAAWDLPAAVLLRYYNQLIVGAVCVHLHTDCTNLYFNLVT